VDDVTVCVGTYGHESWRELAHRAIVSAESQAPVIHEHRTTLAEARNAALDQVETEFVVHLDADDELAPGYVDAMAAGKADLRAPMVQYLGPGITRPAYFPHVWGHEHHACTGECLSQGNWIVVGAAVRTELAHRIRWQEEELYEDWSFFLRCWLATGSVEAIPDAVYRAHVRPDSRNRAPSHAEKERWHKVIYDSCFSDAA
jgi:glycosyltransferase involved in cell wall biosynthesis